VVHPGIGPPRRRDAQRHRHHDREQQRREHQFERGRKPHQQLLTHRLAGGQGIAEVTARQVAQVQQELLGQALVQAQLFAHLRHRLLRAGGPGKERRWIARQRAREQEGDEHDAEQVWQRTQQPSGDLCKHGSGLRP
jgi:hypothetical protein